MNYDENDELEPKLIQCTDQNYDYKPIESWKTPDDEIRLSLKKSKYSEKDQEYFLNRRRRKYNWVWEHGVEIPKKLAWKIAGKLLDPPKEIPKTEFEHYKGWDFIPIQNWKISTYVQINLKIMTNKKGIEKYFLNKQRGSENEGGVEIPKERAFQIGQTLFGLS